MIDSMRGIGNTFGPFSKDFINMIKVFSVSKLSSLPSQAVSTIRKNIFKRLSSSAVEYWTTVDDEKDIEGSLKKISVSQNRYLQYFQKLRWMHTVKPDVILFTGEFLELPFYFLRPRKSTTVLHLNGPLHKSPWSYPYRTFSYVKLWYSVCFFVKRADAVITITQYTANSIKSFRRKEGVYVIYNGVDLDVFRPLDMTSSMFLKEKFGIDPSRPLVIYVGSLIPRKRPDVVIEIAKRCGDMTFVFVGGKSSELDLFSVLHSLKNVIWISKLEREDVAALFGSADVFCFPSLYEGFGMVVAEAMASGCPVITSKGSGPEELIRDGVDGVLIDICDDHEEEIELFIRGIHKIVYNEKEYMKKNAIQRASSLFAWDILASQWEKAFTNIVMSKKSYEK